MTVGGSFRGREQACAAI